MIRESIDQAKMRIKLVPVDQIWATCTSLMDMDDSHTVNPRMIEELKYRELLPAIEAESGKVLKPGALWKPPSDFDVSTLVFHDLLTGAITPPPPEGLEYYICIQAHRRTAALKHIRKHQETYSHETWANAEKLPAVIYDGISLERAQQLANDDEGKEGLSRLNTIKIVFDKFNKGWLYDQVVEEMPQTLFKVFRVSGTVRKWPAVAAITNGKERKAAIRKDLRNDVYTNLYVTHCIGPALVKQSLLNEAKKGGQLKVEGIFMDTKHANIVALGKIYNAEEAASYTPLRLIAVMSTPPQGDDVLSEPADAGEYYVVAGGSENMRNAILGLMRQFRTGESPNKDEVKPLDKTARDNIIKSRRSEVQKAIALKMAGETVENAEELDTKAYHWEKKEALLQSLTGLTPPMEALRVALLGFNLDEISMAFTAKVTNGAVAQKRATAKK